MADEAAAPAATPTPTPTPTRSHVVSSLIDAAAKSFQPVEGAAAPASAATPEQAPPLPSTPNAPATEAALAAEDTASALIRQKNQLADARKALDVERSKWRQEQAEHTARIQAMEKAFQDFEADPAAFAKAHGTKRSLFDLARDLYIEDAQIDKLPPEQAAPIKAERELMRLRREQEKMMAELQRTQMEQRLSMYRGQLSAGLSSLGDSTPLVKALAATNPGMVVAQMEHIAGELALKRPELGPQTAGQLAQILEPQLHKQLEDTSEQFKFFFEKKFKAVPPANPAAAAVSKTQAAAPSLSKDLTPATPARSGKLSLEERIALAARALDGQA